MSNINDEQTFLDICTVPANEASVVVNVYRVSLQFHLLLSCWKFTLSNVCFPLSVAEFFDCSLLLIIPKSLFNWLLQLYFI